MYVIVYESQVHFVVIHVFIGSTVTRTLSCSNWQDFGSFSFGTGALICMPDLLLHSPDMCVSVNTEVTSPPKWRTERPVDRTVAWRRTALAPWAA